MLKRVLFALGVSAIALAGTVELASRALADPPVSNCIGILCAQCPTGYVLSPTPGNCCRCVKVR